MEEEPPPSHGGELQQQVDDVASAAGSTALGVSVLGEAPGVAEGERELAHAPQQDLGGLQAGYGGPVQGQGGYAAFAPGEPGQLVIGHPQAPFMYHPPSLIHPQPAVDDSGAQRQPKAQIADAMNFFKEVRAVRGPFCPAPPPPPSLLFFRSPTHTKRAPS